MAQFACVRSIFGFKCGLDIYTVFLLLHDHRQNQRAKCSEGKGRRAVITDDTRAEVKKMVQAGKTGSEIAKAVGISLPSVQNIKKALGLVEKRK